MAVLGVVHLVWVPFGVPLLERFCASYRCHPAEVEHDLIIIFNGYQSREDLAPFLAALHGIAHTPLYFDQPNQDLHSYYQAAEHLPQEALCFVNSYSQILADGWLRKMYQALLLPNVGLVGATGSWQRAHQHPFYRSDFAGCYSNRGLLLRPVEYVHCLRGWVQFLYKRHVVRKSLAAKAASYPPFPNPHIRTTGFMIRRDLLLRLERGLLLDKEDTLNYESGYNSLTRQIQRMGLQALIVDKEGQTFAPEDWPRSETYRQGTQSHLMISDNRTGEYAEGDAIRRRELVNSSWGRKVRT